MEEKIINFINKTITFIVGAIIFLLIFGGGIIYGTISWGIVLYLFWKWFVITTFISLPIISLEQAIGLFMIINLFKSNNINIVKEEYRELSSENIGVLIAPWMTLFMGWLIYTFINNNNIF